MNRLTKIGKIAPKSSGEITHSRIGLGFEKLDRDVFDPAKAYDKVAACGVKYARLQSGWARTEQEKGVYHFEWLDTVVDNLVSRGIEPWICLCYGNPIYSPKAAEYFGGVGVPPIETEEEKTGWKNYVLACVNRYKDRVSYWEVWNEPDGDWCWKIGVDGEKLGKFTAETAAVIRAAFPKAKIIGGVVCLRSMGFLNDALRAGMAEAIDCVSFHEYVRDERQIFEKVDTYAGLCHAYNPKIQMIQGESGSQSREGGHGALRIYAWTEEIQAKQLARHTMADLMTDVVFTSYFSCMDMVEALNGDPNDVKTYSDYGYFGVLGAEFDENGKSIGEYAPKPSYYVLQNICSLFSDEVKRDNIPVFVYAELSERHNDRQLERFELISGSFSNGEGKAFVYWKPENILTTSYKSSLTMEIYSESDDFKLIDIMDGNIYRLPPECVEKISDKVYRLTELPVKDTPLVLTMGDFNKSDGR